MEKEKYPFWGEEKEKGGEAEGGIHLEKSFFLGEEGKGKIYPLGKKNCGGEEAEKKKEENNWKRKIFFFAEEKKNGKGKGAKYIEKEKVLLDRRLDGNGRLYKRSLGT